MQRLTSGFFDVLRAKPARAGVHEENELRTGEVVDLSAASVAAFCGDPKRRWTTDPRGGAYEELVLPRISTTRGSATPTDLGRLMGSLPTSGSGTTHPSMYLQTIARLQPGVSVDRRRLSGPDRQGAAEGIRVEQRQVDRRPALIATCRALPNHGCDSGSRGRPRVADRVRERPPYLRWAGGGMEGVPVEIRAASCWSRRLFCQLCEACLSTEGTVVARYRVWGSQVCGRLMPEGFRASGDRRRSASPAATPSPSAPASLRIFPALHWHVPTSPGIEEAPRCKHDGGGFTSAAESAA